MKFIAIAFAVLFATATMSQAQTAPCHTVAEMQEQFKDSHTYVIKGEELQRLWVAHSKSPLPFTAAFLVQADDRKSAVHVAFDKNGCAVNESVFLWEIKARDRVLTDVGINVTWVKQGV